MHTTPLPSLSTHPDYLDAYWMPYTGNRDFKAHPRLFVSAKGNYYTDHKGRSILDGLSGLWCCGLGHAQEKIVNAITRQLQTLDYSPAFQFGHPQAFTLANRIIAKMPDPLRYVFFTCSGSEAADTSLKIARAYWRAKGQASKTLFIGREKGYHGVNFGGMSVGGIGPNRKVFGQGVAADHLSHTLSSHPPFTQGQPTCGVESANELEKLIALHDASNIAAVIVEPFSGSGGVIVPPTGYLERLRELCNQHHILLIFDEVISAFGRLGTYSGAEKFGVVPDLLNFAKQVTNGVQPLGGVIATEDIYQTMMAQGGPDYMLEFPHGYTYSAHPVACAAACATLDIIEEEHILEKVNALAPYFERAVHSLKGAKHVTDIRNIGLAAGLTISALPGEPAKRPYQIALSCLEKGFYVRYGGDTIQLAPPFTIQPSEIDSLINALGEAIDTTL